MWLVSASFTDKMGGFDWFRLVPPFSMYQQNRALHKRAKTIILKELLEIN